MTKSTYELAIIVSDDVDVRDIESAIGTLGKLEKKSTSSGASLLKFSNVAGAAALAVGTAVVAAGAASLQMAADAEEAASKFSTVFGGQAKTVGDNLDQFAEAVGRNRFELRRYAADLGDTFTPLGFAADESARLSEQVTKLAVDLASFNNLDEGDVARSLQSALVGNTENLLQFGVVANEAAIKQKALELGLQGVNGQLTAQEKAQAILALTIEGTTAAQGDALRTADSFTNQQRRLVAQLQETAIATGTELLPAANEMLVIFNDLATIGAPLLVAAVEGIVPALQEATRGFGVLTKSGSDFEKFQADVQAIVDSSASARERMARIESAQDSRSLVDRLFNLTGGELKGAEVAIIKEVIVGANDLTEAMERLRAVGIDDNVPYLQRYLEEANLDAAVAGVESFDRALRQMDTSARNTTTQLSAQAAALDGVVAAGQAFSQRQAGGLAAQAASLNSAEDLISRATTRSREYADAVAAGEAALKAREAAISAENRAFAESEALFGEIADAQTVLAASSGEWVQVVRDNSAEISDLNSQLARDLSDEQKKAFSEILDTVDEGSAEWLAAYDALQNDLSDSQRAALIAQRAALEGASPEVSSVYTGDAKAAEEAQKRIEEANAAIIASYRETAFEALLAQSGVTEATLALGVGLGLLTEEQAAARLEFTQTTTALDELANTQGFANASTNDQIEAIQLLTLGYASTAEEALALAGDVNGGLATSLRNATELTDGLAASLDDISGNTTSTVDIIVSGLDALREAQLLTTGIKTITTASGVDVETRASGGDVLAGKTYLVGERGPELVRFGQSGYVYNADQTAGMLGGGVTINANINVSAPDAMTAGQEVRRQLLSIAAAQGVNFG